MKNLLRNALVILASFVFVISVVHAWTGPTATPPGNNADAPVNIGSSNQVKAGGLGVASLLVSGKAVSASTVDGDPDGTLVTKDYLNAKLASGGGTASTTYFARFTYTAGDGEINCYPFGGSCTYDTGTGSGMYNGKVIYMATNGDAACAMSGGKCIGVGYDTDKYAFCGTNIYQSIANLNSNPVTRWQGWSGLGAQCIK